MIKDFLFEIKCAEEIGNYKLADALDYRLVKLAAANHKDIQKKISKKVERESAIKDISFSNTQQKFIVSAEQSLNNSVKRQIKELAGPYAVSFRYSNKNIDELMSGMPEDPMQRHLDELEQLGPDYVGLDEFDNMEPTDEDLRFTAEFPDENEESEMDDFYLEHALKHIKTLPGY